MSIYNATRRDSTIGYLSPVEFERRIGWAKLSVHQSGSSSNDPITFVAPLSTTNPGTSGEVLLHGADSPANRSASHPPNFIKTESEPDLQTD